MTAVRPRNHRPSRWYAALAACLLALAAHASDPAPAPQDDGPYVFDAGKQLDAVWICGGQVQRTSVARTATLPPRCGYPHAIDVPASLPPAVSKAAATPRIVAVSDIHGQYDLLLRLLRANKVIDADDNWALGRDQLVIAGDVFDRGGAVNETLWLLLRLQQQAQQAGGTVHFLLGNHETMALGGDLRYVNPKYLQSARLLKRSYPGLYARDTLLGQWLRTRPVLLQVGDTLFLHGGVSPAELELALHIEQTNAAYRASLGRSKAEVRADPAIAPLYDGKQSPIWYRGYFDGQLGPDEVRALTQRLGVARIVVGHTTMNHISSLHGGRVIAIDSGIKRGESGELLFIENGTLSRGLLDGSRVPLREFPGAPPRED